MRYLHFLTLIRYVFFSLTVMPFASFAATPAVSEQAKESNRVPGPMVTPQAWPGGDVFPTGLFSVKNHFTFLHNTPYKHTSPYTMRSPDGAKTGPRSSDQFVDILKLRYGLAWDRLEIRTATPYINTDIQRHAPQGGTWAGGIGDTTLVLAYGLKKRTDESPFSIALDLGTLLPTGQVGDAAKYPANNAFGIVVGGGVSWTDNNQRVDFDGRYGFNAEGAHNIKRGDYALFHGHYAYALTGNLDLGVEASYRLEQQSELNGKGQHNAFSEFYAGPKMQVKVPEWSSLMIGTALLFPVYRDYQQMRFSAESKLEFSISFAF